MFLKLERKESMDLNYTNCRIKYIVPKAFFSAYGNQPLNHFLVLSNLTIQTILISIKTRLKVFKYNDCRVSRI